MKWFLCLIAFSGFVYAQSPEQLDDSQAINSSNPPLQLTVQTPVQLSAQTHSGKARGPEKLKSFLQEIKTVEAKFEQSILNTETAASGRFQGVFYLSRPDKFRWDYSEPYEKQILADGDTVHIVDTDLEQITYVPQSKALQGTPISVLIGNSAIEERFEVIDIGDSQGMDWVELIPRDKGSQFTRILISFLGEEIRRMEIADNFGQITRFQFFDVKRNPDLDSSLFIFKRRQGFDLIGDL